jgi:5'-deoxynucleotidase YfbR-like HD superfamily hydrolase
VDPFALEQWDLEINDVAHSLANTCRYNGHVRDFYSVAQHAVLVSRRLARTFPGDRTLALWGLHHDDVECLIGDLITPQKDLAPAHVAVEERLLRMVAKRWGLPWPMPAVVKAEDMRALSTELRDLGAVMGDEVLEREVEHARLYPPWRTTIDPWPARTAEIEYLREFGLLHYRERWI